MTESERRALTRRYFLLGGSFAFAGGLLCARALAGILVSPPSLPGTVSDDRAAQIWLGERYLELRPEERSAGRLYRELFGIDLDPRCSRLDGGELLRRIRHRRAADFQHGELVVLDGWLLARTEARVFALAAVGAVK